MKMLIDVPDFVIEYVHDEANYRELDRRASKYAVEADPEI